MLLGSAPCAHDVHSTATTTYLAYLHLISQPLPLLLPVLLALTRLDTASNRRPDLRNPPASVAGAGPPPFSPAAPRARLAAGRRSRQLQGSQGPSQGPAFRQLREASPCSSRGEHAPSLPTGPVTVR